MRDRWFSFIMPVVTAVIIGAVFWVIMISMIAWSLVFLTGLNAPYGARCFLTLFRASHIRSCSPCLNAPYGARCFLTRVCEIFGEESSGKTSLNAPYGFRCFLTDNDPQRMGARQLSLNAPYGARCFLTYGCTT